MGSVLRAVFPLATGRCVEGTGVTALVESVREAKFAVKGSAQPTVFQTVAIKPVETMDAAGVVARAARTGLAWTELVFRAVSPIAQEKHAVTMDAVGHALSSVNRR